MLGLSNEWERWKWARGRIYRSLTTDDRRISPPFRYQPPRQVMKDGVVVVDRRKMHPVEPGAARRGLSMRRLWSAYLTPGAPEGDSRRAGSLLRAVPGISLLDTSSDADHNRTVFTYVANWRRAAGHRGLCRRAFDLVDMTSHTEGTHGWGPWSGAPSSHCSAAWR